MRQKLNMTKVMSLIVFFAGAGWFIGTVIKVNEEEDLHVVEFDGGDDGKAVTVTVKELDRRCEEP